MNWFKKKKASVEPTEFPHLIHERVWKDMPWYMVVRYNGQYKTAGYSIIEPYICVTCGERKNTVLEEEEWSNIDAELREKKFNAVKKKYRKYLKPKAVVEDMINNILLVKDPEYLDMVEVMRGLPHRRCGTSAEMKRIDDDTHQPRIDINNKEVGD